jgi:hypothetical protein
VPVLEWTRGGDSGVITTRYRLPSTALERRLRIVQVEGARTPLRQSVVDELSAPDAHSEMHRRARRLFALPTPAANLPMRLSRSTDVALRVLSALGPLLIEVLCEAVNRSKQPTAGLPPTTVGDLQIGLRSRSATHNPVAGTWSAPAGASPAERDVRLVAALRARGPVTRVQLHQVLLEVGYTARTPQSPIVDRNPLIRRTGPNCYELLA